MATPTTAETAATATTVPRTRDELLAQEPKIDAALKSFYSWWVPLRQQQQQQERATAPTASSTVNPWTSQLALSCTRCLSKAINSHIMAIVPPTTRRRSQKRNNHAIDQQQTQNVNDELQSLVERVWNEQAATPGTKLTKILGRASLAVAWKSASTTTTEAEQQHPADNVFIHHEIKAAAHQNFQSEKHYKVEDEPLLLEFLDAFEQLLLWQPQNNNGNTNRYGPDAVLIWSTTTGQREELARRASQRQAVAQQRVVQEQARQQAQLLAALQPPPSSVTASAAASSSLPHIEELTPNDDNDNSDEPDASSATTDVKKKP